MTIVDVEDGLKVRFPYRDGEFAEGVEIGLLLAELAAGVPQVSREIGEGSVPQAVSLAEGFGYRCLTVASGRGRAEVRCMRRGLRPKLVVVSGT
jgi:hypothetical protein